MSYWNHRVVKVVYDDGTEEFSVRETYYNDDGSITGYTENPVTISATSLNGLKDYLGWCLDSLNRQVLIEGEVEFSKGEWEESV